MFSLGAGEGADGRNSGYIEKEYLVGLSCIPFNAPEARMAAGMAFDEESGAVFLYGGELCRNWLEQYRTII